MIERGGVGVEERIYVGAFEIYRRLEGGDPSLERSTLHVMDDTRRVALIEKRVHPSASAGDESSPRIRYQLDNHLGSSLLEVDETAQPITYEEFLAYGGTAYAAATSEIEANRKRYRYSSKERDDETGLYYYGARYFAPWIGRWVSADPAGMVDGMNVFVFSRSSPVVFEDPDGRQSSETEEANLPEVGVERLQIFVIDHLTGEETLLSGGELAADADEFQAMLERLLISPPAEPTSGERAAFALMQVIGIDDLGMMMSPPEDNPWTEQRARFTGARHTEMDAVKAAPRLLMKITLAAGALRLAASAPQLLRSGYAALQPVVARAGAWVWERAGAAVAAVGARALKPSVWLYSTGSYVASQYPRTVRLIERATAYAVGQTTNPMETSETGRPSFDMREAIASLASLLWNRTSIPESARSMVQSAAREWGKVLSGFMTRTTDPYGRLLESHH